MISSERLAARIYDKGAIIELGLKAKTNFNYTKMQLEKILRGEDELDESDCEQDNSRAAIDI